MGALDGFDVKADVLSYEGPFGVGYCVAEFHIRHSKSRLINLKKAKDGGKKGRSFCKARS